MDTYPLHRTKVELEKCLRDAYKQIDDQKAEIEKLKTSLHQQNRLQQDRVQSLEVECAAKQTQLQELQAKYDANDQQYKKILPRNETQSDQPCQNAECKEEKDRLRQIMHNIQSKPCEREACVQTATRLKEVECGCTIAKQELESVTQELRDMEKKPSQPCQRNECRRTKTELKRVNQERQRECQRQECLKTKQDLLGATQQIERMQTQMCNSKRCQNAQLSLLSTRIGPSITSTDGEDEIPMTTLMVKLYNMIERNQKMLQQENQDLQNKLDAAMAENATLLKELCTNQECIQIREYLQRRVKELQNAFMAAKCTRPDCQELQKQVRDKQLQIIAKARPGDDMEKQRGGDHDKLIDEFEHLTTDPNGVLRVLEAILDEFEAKRLLSKLFQHAYDKCKDRVIHTLCQSLLSGLFEVQTNTPEKQGTLNLEEASRAFGLLLDAFGLKTETVKTEVCVAISKEIYNDFKQDPSFSQVQSVLQSAHEGWLGRIVQLTWQFTTLPTPIIMCQPKTFHDHIHARQYGHWDKQKLKANDYKLVYLRPVVYRCYRGPLASKGWVAMEGVDKEGEKPGTNTQSDGKGKGSCTLCQWS